MSNDWSRQTLGSLIDIKHGFAFKSKFFSETPTLFQLTTPGNFAIGGGFKLGKEKFYSGPVPDDYVLKPGDLLVTMTDLSKAADSLGYAAVVPETKGITWLHNQRIGLISIKPGASVSLNFLHYLMRSPDYRNWVISTATGSTVKHTSPSRICEFDFLLPTIDYQTWIAETLGALDDCITILRQTNSTLEAIAQALYKSWFLDFDPVRAKQDGKKPEEMDEATASLFPSSFEQSELGKIPNGWKVQLLDKFLETLETGRRPKGGVRGIANGIPSIGAESIIKIGDFDYQKLKFVSTDFFKKMISGKLESRDVLLYKDGVYVSRISMFGDGFPFEVCGINEHVFRIRIKKPFNQTFLYFWFCSDRVVHELKHRASKAVIPGINQNDVKQLKIIVPTLEILNSYENIVEKIISRIFLNSKKIKTLSDLRDTLLPRLISGKLRPVDVEEINNQIKVTA
jgi:type I restriction enzyme S subunit